MKNIPTKQKILFSALELFAEKGYDGVGVDLIAENAGMKGPSLYRHYKGKEDIFHSMMDMVTSHYSEGFGSNCEEDVPESMEELVCLSLEKIRFTMQDDIIRKIRRILAMEQFRNERMAELTTKYHLENQQKMYTEIFAKMMEKGILKEEDPKLLALEFIAPVSLLIHLYDRQPEREEEVLDQIRKHFKHFIQVYSGNGSFEKNS